KVIDFGVAKALGQGLTDKTLFTGVAQMVGTPLYMSPEQAGMSDLDADTPSDVYSLGVLLYELLARATPFPPGPFPAASFTALRRPTPIRRGGAPTGTRRRRPHERAPRVGARGGWARGRVGGGGRVALAGGVLGCGGRPPARRYETAAGLARDVEHSLADEP